MTYDEICKVNEATKSTDIGKGKDYIEVNQRIKAFRMLYPAGAIKTELISNIEGMCIFRAEAFDEEGKFLGSGTAYEKEGSSFINKTSYIENCETSAVGRALAMCGIGIDASIASKEEVENAKLNQSSKNEQPKEKSNEEKQADAVNEAESKIRVLKYVNENKFSKEDIAKICKRYQVGSLSELTKAHCDHYISLIEAHGGKI